MSTPAVPGVFVWNSFTPRVGFTLAVDDALGDGLPGPTRQLRPSM